MPTITWGGAASYGGPANAGSQTATFTHPKELRHYGYPKPPLPRLSDFASILAEFQALMNTGKYEAIMSFGVENYCGISISDVPGGAVTALKNWISYEREGKSIPTCLLGPVTDWVNAGTTVTRAAFD